MQGRKSIMSARVTEPRCVRPKTPCVRRWAPRSLHFLSAFHYSSHFYSRPFVSSSPPSPRPPQTWTRGREHHLIMTSQTFFISGRHHMQRQLLPLSASCAPGRADVLCGFPPTGRRSETLSEERRMTDDHDDAAAALSFAPLE